MIDAAGRWAGDERPAVIVTEQNGFNVADHLDHLGCDIAERLVQLFHQCRPRNFLARASNERTGLFHIEVNVRRQHCKRLVPALEATVVSARVPWVEVEAEEGVSVNLDGEPISGTKLRFEARPGALRLHVPDDCPLITP